MSVSPRKLTRDDRVHHLICQEIHGRECCSCSANGSPACETIARIASKITEIIQNKGLAP